MKTLYLVRHAKSSWKFPHLADHDRPLNRRGKSNAPEMGERLKKQGILPDLLLSSTAKRAATTAANIAEQIGYETSKIEHTPQLFHAGEDTILEVTQNIDNQYGSVMLFGHNPGFTWFANELGYLSIDNIPTCGIIAFHLPVNLWEEVEFGMAQLLFFDYPKNKKL